MKTVIFVNSHPIQYFAPMYRYMNEQGVSTQAWYCSDESVRGRYDREFGAEVKWDIPLLDGYDHQFFRNYARRPSPENGFLGLVNPGMVRALFRIPPSVIVMHGWHYSTHLLLLLLGKLRGHTICLRNDMPQKQEVLKTGWKQVVKRLGLRYLLFPRIDYFLYVGQQNRLLYKSYDIADDRLLFCPYAVDNARFQRDNDLLSHRIPALKQQLGIPADDRVILYSAKYIPKKQPLDLLRAFAALNQPDIWLVMVGEGELRPAMEACIAENRLERVILTGFVNQSRIAEYYALSDVFVMCSSAGENWGLSVNEAMNFDLPLVLSDLTGCTDDLVREGVNGYVFSTGDVGQLTERLRQVLAGNSLSWTTSSRSIVDEYSFAATTESLRRITANA